MARPRAFEEQAVIRRAREVFHDHGYAPASVEQLTAATALSRGSLYGAFGDKHRLFLLAFAQYCDEQKQVLDRELAGDDRGARSRLEEHLRGKVRDPDASRRGCLLAKTAAELGSDDPDVAPMILDFYDHYRGALTACVRGAQNAGALRTDLDADRTGALLLSVLRGIEALGRAGTAGGELHAIADTALAALAAP